MEYTSNDANQNGNIDFSGSDRVRQNVSDYLTLSSPWSGVIVRRTRTYEYNLASSAATVLVSENWVTMDGLKSWNLPLGSASLMSRSESVVNQSAATTVTTSTVPDGSYVTTTSINGRTDSIVARNSGGTQISQVVYGYDAHGRNSSITDARNGTTLMTYNAADSVVTVTTPAPGTGQSSQVRSSVYDSLGRIWKSIDADGGECNQ